MNLSEKGREHVERYRRLRSVAKNSMWKKLSEEFSKPEYDIISAAQKMTVPIEDRTLVFEGETCMNALKDFSMHEMRYDGKRIVDIVVESDTELESEERELLEAHRHSRCSLFSIVSLEPELCQLRIRDVLKPASPVFYFTDINLSHTRGPIRGSLFFTRLLDCQDIHFGSGFYFTFSAVHKLHLLNAFKARMPASSSKDYSWKMFVFFYQKYLQLGGTQIYEDVV